ncbi:MAG: maleylpyruvate isomerase family mycothiol-dependent enzyme [Actinomycetota bacterium]|nr:maleylpyruvate isomerase family mycothiol-dependent enzyme [Actinomycetota bacterium]
MNRSDFIAELERQGQALGSAAREAGLDAEVPTCPTWTVADLVAHIGKVHRWATRHVREPVKTGQHALAKAPKQDLLDWYAEGHAALVEAFRHAPPDVRSWTFLPAPSPLEFWARRQAHETAIHRADADACLGVRPDYDAEFAGDGVAELIDGFFARGGGSLRSAQPRTLRVSLIDDDRVWHITIGAQGREISHDGCKPAEAAVAAPASAMYLFLWNRLPRDQVEVSGDESVLDLWQEKAHIRWG